MLFCLESHDCFEMLKLEAEMQMKIRVEVDGRFLCDAIDFQFGNLVESTTSAFYYLVQFV